MTAVPEPLWSTGFGALVLSMPELEVNIGPRLLMTLPDLAMTDAATNAHMTLLGPLVEIGLWSETVYQQLAEVAATTAAPRLRFSQVRQMTPNHTCLVLEDPTPAALLRERLERVVPPDRDTAPTYQDYVPHVTLDYRSNPTRYQQCTTEYHGQLPLTITAAELCLYWWAPRRSRALRRWWLAGLTERTEGS